MLMHTLTHRNTKHEYTQSHTYPHTKATYTLIQTHTLVYIYTQTQTKTHKHTYSHIQRIPHNTHKHTLTYMTHAITKFKRRKQWKCFTIQKFIARESL